MLVGGCQELLKSGVRSLPASARVGAGLVQLDRWTAAHLCPRGASVSCVNCAIEPTMAFQPNVGTRFIGSI